MNKLKKFFLIILSALSLCLILPFTGCAAEGTYIEDTYSYDCRESYYAYEQYYSCSFEINVPSTGNYVVTFDIEATVTDVDASGVKTSNTSRKTVRNCVQRVTVYNVQNLKCEVSYSTTFDGDYILNDDDNSIDIKNVKVKKVDNVLKSDGYLIGFGAAAWVIFIGLIIALLIDKFGKKKS